MSASILFLCGEGLIMPRWDSFEQWLGWLVFLFVFGWAVESWIRAWRRAGD